MGSTEPLYSDLPDYILKITKEIWEDRGLTTLRRHYAPDVVVRMSMGTTVGNEAAIDGTLATLAEFPDRQLLAEDVIWCGDEEVGFLSSHRAISICTHTGFGAYGPPTGRSVTVRGIADCAVKKNVIFDEWLTRDSSAIAIQLGLDPSAYARTLIERECGRTSAQHNAEATSDPSELGLYKSRGNNSPWGQRLAEILEQIMHKDLAVIGREYDRAVRTEHPGLRVGWGRSFTGTAWVGLRSAFPSARFEVEHVIGREDINQPRRAAVRWTLTGTHDGFGLYGAPTGAQIRVLGITHAEWGPWGLRREYTVFDEVAIWKQIHLHTGAFE